jgi:hypothetical protein
MRHISRFASFATIDPPLKVADKKAAKTAPPKSGQAKQSGKSAIPQQSAKPTAVQKQSRFAHMRAATVQATAQAASAGARAVTLTGKSLTRAMTPAEEKDILHDLSWHGRVRSDAERSVSPFEKRAAAKRMRRSAEKGIARSSAAYRQVD